MGIEIIANHELHCTIFETPSGNVRGTVTVFSTVKGKRRRIAHATLLVASAPLIELDVPRNMPLDEMPLIISALSVFEAKVNEFAIQR